MTEPITLYDFPGHASPTIAWNPNVWKIRYTLNIKGIPYKTVWLEYTDIEHESKRVGVPPNGKRPNGTDLYTLPAIFDPNTGAGVSESEKIAYYLEKQYPNPSAPVLFPPGTRALQRGFCDTFVTRVRSPVRLALLYPNSQQLNGISKEYFTATREEAFGAKLSEIAPAGSDKYAVLAKTAVEGFAFISNWIDTNESKGPFVMGEQPCFADCYIAGWLTWTHIIAGDGEGSIWTAIAQAEGGRWKNYLKEFEKWSVVQ